MSHFLRVLRKLKEGVNLPQQVTAYHYFPRVAPLGARQRQQSLTACLNQFGLGKISTACCVQFPSMVGFDRGKA